MAGQDEIPQLIPWSGDSFNISWIQWISSCMKHASIHFFNLNSSSNPDIWIPHQIQTSSSIHFFNSNSINPLNSRPQHLSNIHCLNSLIQLIDSRRINCLNCMRNSLMKLIPSSIASTVFRIHRQVPCSALLWCMLWKRHVLTWVRWRNSASNWIETENTHATTMLSFVSNICSYVLFRSTPHRLVRGNICHSARN